MTRPASEPSGLPARAASQASAPRRVFHFMGTVFMAIVLTGCPGAVKPDAGNPLAVATCPEKLPELAQNTSFGDTVTKLVEVAGIYHRCRVAAVGAKE